MGNPVNADFSGVMLAEGGMMDRIKYIKVQQRCGGNSYIDKLVNISISDLFEGDDMGEGFVLTVIDITDEEFKKLPEFTGF